MTASTKVTIAVVVLFAVVLGVYYGFSGPAPDEQAGQVGELPVEPVAAQADAGRGARPLSSSVEEALAKAEPEPEPTVVMGGVTKLRPEPVVRPQAVRQTQTWPTLAALDQAPATHDTRTTSSPAGTRTPVKPATTTDYAVREGDSMWTISKRVLGDASRWREIAALNPTIDAERLRVGQRIRVPAGATTTSKAPLRLNGTAKVPHRPVGAKTYTVRSGDTLSTIAKGVYGTPAKWKTIWDANRDLIGANPDRLEVGTRLRIPGVR